MLSTQQNMSLLTICRNRRRLARDIVHILLPHMWRVNVAMTTSRQCVMATDLALSLQQTCLCY